MRVVGFIMGYQYLNRLSFLSDNEFQFYLRKYKTTRSKDSVI